MIAVSSRLHVHLRISVTNRCQLRCLYCDPAPTGCRRQGAARLSPETILTFVHHAQRLFDVRKVRLTGGEPLLRADLPSLIRALAEVRIPDLALTTNGQQLAARVGALRAAGLTRVNISLDSLRPDRFRRLSGGGELEPTLAGIHAAVAGGLFPVKLNMVVMRGINDDEVADLAAFALAAGCELRFLELMPVGPEASDFPGRFMPAAAIRERLGETYRLAPLDPVDGTTSRPWRIEDAAGRVGRVGFVAPCSEPFCNSCRRLRLTSDGCLVGCLARQDDRVDLRSLLASPQAWVDGNGDAMLQEALNRRGERRFEHCAAMASVGG